MLAVWFGLGLLFLAFHPGLPRHPPKKKNTHNQTAPNRQRLKDINHQKTYDLRILRTCCFPSTLQLLIQTVSLTFSNVTPREKQWQQNPAPTWDAGKPCKSWPKKNYQFLKLRWLDIFHQQYQTLHKVTNHIFPPPLSSPQDDEHVGDLIAWPKSHIVVSSFPVAFEDANSEHTNHLPHRCPPGSCAVFLFVTFKFQNSCPILNCNLRMFLRLLVSACVSDQTKYYVLITYIYIICMYKIYVMWQKYWETSIYVIHPPENSTIIFQALC